MTVMTLPMDTCTLVTLLDSERASSCRGDVIMFDMEYADINSQRTPGTPWTLIVKSICHHLILCGVLLQHSYAWHHVLYAV